MLRNGHFSATLCLCTETTEDLCYGMDTSVQHCVCVQRQLKTYVTEWTHQCNTVFVYRDNRRPMLRNGHFSATLCLCTETTEDLCYGMDTSVQHCVYVQRQLKTYVTEWTLQCNTVFVYRDNRRPVLRNGHFSATLCLSTETTEDLCYGMDTSVQHCVCVQRQLKTCVTEWTLQCNTVFVYRDN